MFKSHLLTLLFLGIFNGNSHAVPTLHAIFEAAATNDLDGIATLIKKYKFDVNAESSDRSTPLMHAARAGHVTMIDFLIGAGADVKRTTKSGGTALHCAADEAHMSAVEKLASAGADVNAQDHLGTTPLMAAAGVNCIKGDARSLAQNERLAVITFLVDHGAKTDSVRHDALSLIHIAVQFESTYGCTGITDYFIEKGADVNQQFVGGNTPLVIAVSYGNRCTVDLLLKAGASVNQKDGTTGNVALHHAVQEEHLPVIKQLISANADVNSRSYSGDTPLHIAIANHHIKAAGLLIDSGADLYVKNNEGFTPIRLAEELEDFDMMSFLKEAQAKRYTPPIGVTPTRIVGGFAAVAVLLVIKYGRAFGTRCASVYNAIASKLMPKIVFPEETPRTRRQRVRRLLTPPGMQTPRRGLLFHGDTIDAALLARDIASGMETRHSPRAQTQTDEALIARRIGELNNARKEGHEPLANFVAGLINGHMQEILQSDRIVRPSTIRQLRSALEAAKDIIELQTRLAIMTATLDLNARNP